MKQESVAGLLAAVVLLGQGCASWFDDWSWGFPFDQVAPSDEDLAIYEAVVLDHWRHRSRTGDRANTVCCARSWQSGFPPL